MSKQSSYTRVLRLSATLCMAVMSAALFSQKLTAQQTEQQTRYQRTLQLLETKGCASCHGTRGQGNPRTRTPSLKDQPRAELIRKITAYRDRDRKHAAMNLVTSSLTDEDIRLLAEWFSQQ